jgi:hypothetical protein
MVKRRYLIHEINHTILVIDETPIGLPGEIYPPEGKEHNLYSLRFQTWRAAEQHLLKMGAELEVLQRTRRILDKQSVAGLTILE